MNSNIINTYFEIIKLKEVLRTGWPEVGITESKVESVMDHIGGTIFLAMLIDSEKKLGLNMSKVYEMIAINEIKKIETNSEQSIANNTEYSEDFVLSILNKISNNERLISEYDEIKAKNTEEAKFVIMVSKLESDIQAKKYELDGEFTLENARKDIEKYPEDIKANLTNIEKASDGWLTYDKKYYDQLFTELSDEIKKR